MKKNTKILIGAAALYAMLLGLLYHMEKAAGNAGFGSIWDTVWYSLVTMTTVGYGDVCPVTSIGRFVSMLSSLFGVAIIALPSGVITASYLDELRNKQEEKEKGRRKNNRETEL